MYTYLYIYTHIYIYVYIHMYVGRFYRCIDTYACSHIHHQRRHATPLKTSIGPSRTLQRPGRAHRGAPGRQGSLGRALRDGPDRQYGFDRIPNPQGVTHTHTPVYMYIHIHAYMHTCTSTHIRVDAHTHTCTCTHMSKIWGSKGFCF